LIEGPRRHGPAARRVVVRHLATAVLAALLLTATHAARGEDAGPGGAGREPWARGSAPTAAPRQVAQAPLPAPRGKKLGTAQSNFLAADRAPVIFLPGVAGSILFDRPIIGDQLWPFSPLGKRAALRLQDDGRTPAMTGVAVTAFDIIRTKDANFSTLKNVYGGLVDFLQSRGYREGTDFNVFPYDWRLDNATHFEALDLAIRNTLGATGRDKVVLLGHSMGGVIARAYILSKPERAARVEALISLATPYWGSPKVYYALINGYDFGNPTIRPELMKILARNMPAAYQLLPIEPFIVDVPKTARLCPTGRLVFCPERLRQFLTLAESYAVRYRWFSAIEADIRDTYVPTPDNVQTMNRNLVDVARAFHAPVGTAERPRRLPGDVKQYAIIGYGISTLNFYFMSDATAEDVSRGRYLEMGDGRRVVMAPRFGDGDGTVPLWGLRTSTATKTYYVPHQPGALSGLMISPSAAHADLPLNLAAQELVIQLLEGKVPDETPFRYVESSLVSEESLDLTLPGP
jgi:pimeloyl-ACP methyl ester carboxylesterase